MARKSKRNRAGSARSQRQLRFGEMLRHALVEIFTRGEIRDPGLDGVSLTITEVRVSPDLRNATIFVIPLGGDKTAEALAALRRAAPYLRGQLARNSTTRTVPRLSFAADDAFDEGQHIESLLRSPEVARDLVESPEEPGPEEKDGA